MAMNDWIGREMRQRDRLTPALLARFRATIDSDAQGPVGAQGIHWCLCLPDAATASLDHDGHPLRGGFLPPVPLPRRMWASSEVQFLAPIAADAEIERVSTIASVREKQGGSGPLVFVEIAHDSLVNGECAVRELQTLVYREAADGAPMPLPAGEADLSDWGWQRSLTPGAPLLFRYSALTFNSHRIHYDARYAVEVERYRGLVVHGPLTATLLLDLAARELGDNRLTRFGFRGMSPAFADEALHLVGRREGARLTLAALGSDGREVMRADAEVAAGDK